jgi:hypothetical protein
MKDKINEKKLITYLDILLMSGEGIVFAANGEYYRGYTNAIKQIKEEIESKSCLVCGEYEYEG